MKVATWNINSIRTRQRRVLEWVGRHQPDILCLQELKVAESGFPFAPLREAGYEAAVHGQPTYNGVAIVSRRPLRDVQCGFADGLDDPEARFIAAGVDDLRVLCAYVPNGGSVGSDGYAEKLAWLRRLRGYLERRESPHRPLLVCGDFNIAPDDLDVANPQWWAKSVMCHPSARERFGQLLDWGLIDVVRLRHPEGGLYSWWDYQQFAFRKNDGLRIDHILATPVLAHDCIATEIDREERAGQQPSDHAPVVAAFTD